MQQYTRVLSSFKAIDGRLGVPALVATAGWLLSNPNGYRAPRGGIKAQLKRYVRVCSRFEKDWQTFTERYLTITKAPIAENRFHTFYRLSYRPSDTPHPLRYMSAKEGVATAEQGYQYAEPQSNYTAIPVELLRDNRLSAAAKSVVMMAIRALDLQQHKEGYTASKEGMCADSGVSPASFEAAWREAKNSGWLVQQRLVNETTGKVEWAYTVATSIVHAENVKVGHVIAPAQRKSRVAAIEHIKQPANVATLPSERAAVEAIVKDNINYPYLLQNVGTAPLHYHTEDVDAYVRLIVDTVCSPKKTLRIGGQEIPADTVRMAFMALRYEHIEGVMRRLAEAAGESVHNLVEYKRTALYNATLASIDEFGIVV